MQKKIISAALFVYLFGFLPMGVFGQTKGLFNFFWGGAFSQSESTKIDPKRYEEIKEYFKQKEEIERAEVARLSNYARRTNTEKYLPPHWRSRTPGQQLIILQTHKEWLGNLTKKGYLNPEEFLLDIKKATKEGSNNIVLRSGNITRDFKIDEKVEINIMDELKRHGYKGTQIRFDFDDGYGGIELVVVRLVYNGKDYGLTKGLNPHSVKTEPAMGVGGINYKDGQAVYQSTREIMEGFKILAKYIIEKKTAPLRQPEKNQKNY